MLSMQQALDSGLSTTQQMSKNQPKKRLSISWCCVEQEMEVKANSLGKRSLGKEILGNPGFQ